MVNSKEKSKEKKEEKTLRCPFSKDLECADCRLYQTYIGGKGARKCVFLDMKEV